MNADAEKEIDRLLNMLIHPSTARPIIIAAMQFAYADAARVCVEMEEPDDMSYYTYKWKLASLIEQRAKHDPKT